MTLGQLIINMRRSGCDEFRIRLDATCPAKVINSVVEGHSQLVILEGCSSDYHVESTTCLFDAAYHEDMVDRSVQYIIDAYRKHKLELYAQHGRGESK